MFVMDCWFCFEGNNAEKQILKIGEEYKLVK